jgi:riboflavin kinase/FMN adenylyltransferase
VKLVRTLRGAQDLALAIGNFDGVHLGHQALLAASVRTAAERGLTPAAMSFHPLPREAFARMTVAPMPVRLMSVTEKLAALSNAKIEVLFLPKFDRAFASQSPEEFAKALAAMGVRWVITGEDFRFGAKRAGDAAMLRELGAQLGFEATTLPDVSFGNQRVSSTAIRDALARGLLDSAAHMLGRRYAIVGRVTHGEKLGRTLGFPTINVCLSARNPALSGVYAVQCRLVTRGLEGVAGQGGMILNGVANLGTNPVVSSENRQHLEVFLFDFSSDLYGKRVEITFIEKIRDELKLASLDALVVQMHDDARRAKDILRTVNDGNKG